MLPIARRVRHAMSRIWPALVWVVAAASAGMLYQNEGARGQTLAYSEMMHHELTPEISGRLLVMKLEVGQTVQRGEVVARIDPQDIDDRIAPVGAAVARLEARVKARRKRLKGDREDAADIAVKAALCGTAPDRALAQIDMLTTEQASDRGEAAALEEQLSRLKPLLDQHVVTAERMDEIKVRKTILAGRIAGRGKELRRREECLDLSAEVDLDIQKMTLARLERERAKYDVVAPVSGTIENISHRSGEWIAAGTAVAEIVVPRLERVIAYVTDQQVRAVSIGTRVTLATRGHEGPTLRGHVVALGPRIEQVPLRLRFIPTIAQWGRLVTIDVEPPGASLPGEIFNASFGP